jgi:hypothetical protein
MIPQHALTTDAFLPHLPSPLLADTDPSGKEARCSINYMSTLSILSTFVETKDLFGLGVMGLIILPRKNWSGGGGLG